MTFVAVLTCGGVLTRPAGRAAGGDVGRGVTRVGATHGLGAAGGGGVCPNVGPAAARATATRAGAVNRVRGMGGSFRGNVPAQRITAGAASSTATVPREGMPLRLRTLPDFNLAPDSCRNRPRPGRGGG